MKNYQSIIGLEIHVQLKTKSKMFCGCSADYRDDPPNTHCCPVCLGLPGALPVANKKTIEQVLLMGLALGCKINKQSYFARKNYFYPDLPKGYQITQYDKPFCYEGELEVKGTKKQRDKEIKKKIGITRIHLEEDTGKSIHVKEDNEEYTLLDFNKSGIPLMEIVTEPDFRNAGNVVEFAKIVRRIVRYLDISDADMEKGQLRVEPNISVRKMDSKNLPDYKVEIKNLNSFASLKKGVDYEIKRQIELLEKGEAPKQETRGWDENKQATFSQRSKEEAHDYRYFPEPDIPPIEIQESKKTIKQKDNDGIYLDELRKELPELPMDKAVRFTEDYNIRPYDAEILTQNRELADWFEQAIKSADKKLAKKIANWVITEVLGSMEDGDIKELNLRPGQLAKIVELVESSRISRTSGKDLLQMVFQAKAFWPDSKDIEDIIREERMEKVSDEGELEVVVDQVIAANPKSIADYKSGKKQSIQFLIGQVMKETKGKADISKVKPLLEEKLAN